jgi:hypothetical protein
VEVDGTLVEYIEVTLTDIETANRLANVVLGQSMDELVKPSRTLLSKIYEMVKEQAEQNNAPIDEIFFTRRMIREYTGWSDWQVQQPHQTTHRRNGIHRCPARFSEAGSTPISCTYQGQAEERLTVVIST